MAELLGGAEDDHLVLGAATLSASPPPAKIKREEAHGKTVVHRDGSQHRHRRTHDAGKKSKRRDTGVHVAIGSKFDRFEVCPRGVGARF